MLKQRIITAVILISLFLGVLFFAPPFYFFLMMIVLSLAAFCEWTNLMPLKTRAGKLLYFVLALFFLTNSIPIPLHLILVVSVIFWLFATFFVVFYPRFSQWFAKNIFIRGFLGLIVIIPTMRALCYLRSLEDGVFVILYLFLLIWGADTSAYFVGKRFGKRKLLPLVSPGKSVIGALAAVAFSLVLTLLVLKYKEMPFAVWGVMLLLGVATTVFSIIGDLFESLLKRQIGIKDSGKLLPGHGGLLDRIDSLTAAAPIFAFGAILLSR